MLRITSNDKECKISRAMHGNKKFKMGQPNLESFMSKIKYFL